MRFGNNKIYHGRIDMERNAPRRWGYLWILSMMALWIVAIGWLLLGCTSTRYVPVENVHTEYVEADTTGIYDRLRLFFELQYNKESSSDSMIDRQKEIVVLKENGDTVRREKEHIVYVSSRHEKELEHRISEQDSVIKALRLQLTSVKSDSIPIPYPVERTLTKWERAKMNVGRMAIGAFLIAICAAVVWLVRKFRK